MVDIPTLVVQIASEYISEAISGGFSFIFLHSWALVIYPKHLELILSGCSHSVEMVGLVHIASKVTRRAGFL